MNSACVSFNGEALLFFVGKCFFDASLLTNVSYFEGDDLNEEFCIWEVDAYGIV